MEDEHHENSMQRFEELVSLLNRYCSKSSPLNGRQINALRSARVFPVLRASETSQQGTDIDLRSLDDDTDWYIADKTTLDCAFRGKVDILALSVKSFLMLAELFGQLKCGGRYLSSAVVEEVIPRGECIRDHRVEQDLKTRLKYAS
jgi:hypothetical protein